MRFLTDCPTTSSCARRDRGPAGAASSTPPAALARPGPWMCAAARPSTTGRSRDGHCATSWNLAEASIGQAAINSWYSREQTAAANGFEPTGEGLTWRQVFDPYREMIVGKRVAVIGHFPFAEAALAGAGEYICLERNLQPGDWPDSACEYVLPECDLVFISSSSFVNKTAPRLIELSRDAHTVLVGPSTPLNPVLLDYGVDTITGFVAASSLSDPASLAEMVPAGDIGPGFRVHRHRA